MSEAAGSPDRAGAMVCGACGTEASSTEQYCRRCGAALAEADATGATTALPPVQTRTAGLADAGTTAGARTCPACGASNDPRRELCGTCGADLDSGMALPSQEPIETELVRPSNGTESAHRRHLWMGVGAVVAVAVLIVAGLAIAGVGPFEREPELPSAEFDSGWYQDDAGPLLLSDIAALTTRPPEGVDVFTPAQMVDLEPTTAWYNDGSTLTDGVGEKIDLFLASPAWVEHIIVTNGDQTDADTYAASARMKRVLVTFDGGVSYVLNLLDLGLQRQVIELPEPVLTTTVRLEVEESFTGDSTHLAVSDIELQGWTADGPDVDLADERAAMRRAAGPAELPDAVVEADEESQGS